MHARAARHGAAAAAPPALTCTGTALGSAAAPSVSNCASSSAFCPGASVSRRQLATQRAALHSPGGFMSGAGRAVPPPCAGADACATTPVSAPRSAGFAEIWMEMRTNGGAARWRHCTRTGTGLSAGAQR
ncbi:hypothetical protein JKP88DRAFT_251823 [Tribonema minus]|uniref:Uncharacterized protein n=1 Tax=Tribonema minus TaxID=303371 RepID=A0A836CMX9_9STRA|nr:hypothetical protein JKP88DRAFT_251823 [Tribonema minus]